MTKTKIKIVDNSSLRAEIDDLYELTNQIELAKWAIKCVKHLLNLINFEVTDIKAIENGFKVNEQWQLGNLSVHEVRLAGFKIHQAARLSKSKILENAFRAAGQAVGVGHMKEHAMICSDYVIKTVQLIYPNQLEKITEERQWQLDELIKFSTKTSP